MGGTDGRQSRERLEGAERGHQDDGHQELVGPRNRLRQLDIAVSDVALGLGQQAGQFEIAGPLGDFSDEPTYQDAGDGLPVEDQ